mgnify:CR=1
TRSEVQNGNNTKMSNIFDVLAGKLESKKATG